MNNTLKLAGLTLIGLLAACGQLSNPSSNLTPADTQALSETSQSELALTGAMLSDAGVSGASAQSVNSLAAEVEAHAIGFGLPRRIVHVLNALEAYIPDVTDASCTITKDPAAPTDADNDGTPASLKMTFNCAGTRSNGTAYTTEGVATLQDTDDAQANSGFSLKLENFHAKITRTDGTVVERTVNGSFERDKTTANWQIKKQYSHKVSITKGSNVYNGSVDLLVNKTYTPDDAAKPWAAGTITVDKAVPGSLTWVRNAVTRNLIWYTDPSIHWNRAACQAPARVLNFDSGAKEYVYTNPQGQKSTLRLVFGGCGNITTTLTQDGSTTPVN